MKYLEDWRRSTLTRPGEYSPDERGKMYGFEYVLTERFMQDVLEDYFGHQRARGGRSDNPTAQQFGYNNLTIATQRDIAPVIGGNVGGRYEVQKWQVI